MNAVRVLCLFLIVVGRLTSQLPLSYHLAANGTQFLRYGVGEDYPVALHAAVLHRFFVNHEPGASLHLCAKENMYASQSYLLFFLRLRITMFWGIPVFHQPFCGDTD